MVCVYFLLSYEHYCLLVHTILLSDRQFTFGMSLNSWLFHSVFVGSACLNFVAVLLFP